MKEMNIRKMVDGGRVKVCHGCGGRGWISVYDYTSHTRGLISHSEKCPVCMGQRLVVKKVSVSYVPYFAEKEDKFWHADDAD